VQIGESNEYIYPDVSVTRDVRDKTAVKFISHPCLIIEVLSPSNESRDRWEKFNLYRRSDSLQDYVLVDANKIEIALYSKNDRGKWEISRYVAGDMVELKSVNLTFPIEQLFEDIIFEAESAQIRSAPNAKLTRSAIDADLAQMAYDSEYQAEALRIEAEFSTRSIG
jgi:Uma2 family endonuclease